MDFITIVTKISWFLNSVFHKVFEDLHIGCNSLQASQSLKLFPELKVLLHLAPTDTNVASPSKLLTPLPINLKQQLNSLHSCNSWLHVSGSIFSFV